MINEILKLLILIIIGVSIGFLIKMVIDPYLQQSEQQKEEYKTYKIFSNEFIQKQKLKQEQQRKSQLQEQEYFSEKDQSPQKNEEEIINHQDGAQNEIISVSPQPQQKRGELLDQEPAQIETVLYNNETEIYLKEAITSKIVLNPVMPKQSVFQNELRDFILKLYDETKQNASDLIISKSGQRDSNTFYSGIVFQYFSIILNKYDDNQFQYQLNKIKKMRYQIVYKDLTLPNKSQQQLSLNLIKYLQKLRQKENKNNELQQLMNDSKSEFYGLSIIYIRNLIYQQIKQQDDVKVEDRNQILNWEAKYQNNQFINQLLAEELDLTINIHTVDREYDDIKISTYGSNKQHQIDLTYEQGIYSIGNPIQSQE